MTFVMVSSLITLPLLHLLPTTTTFSLASYFFMKHMLSFLTFLLSLPLPTKFLPKTNMVFILTKNYFLHFILFFPTSPTTCAMISFCSNESAFPSSFQLTKAWFFFASSRIFFLFLSCPFQTRFLFFSSSQNNNKRWTRGRVSPIPFLWWKGTPLFFPHVWVHCTSLLELSYLMGQGIRCHKDTTLHFYPFRIW